MLRIPGFSPFLRISRSGWFVLCPVWRTTIYTPGPSDQWPLPPSTPQWHRMGHGPEVDSDQIPISAMAAPLNLTSTVDRWKSWSSCASVCRLRLLCDSKLCDLLCEKCMVLCQVLLIFAMHVSVCDRMGQADLAHARHWQVYWKLRCRHSGTFKALSPFGRVEPRATHHWSTLQRLLNQT